MADRGTQTAVQNALAYDVDSFEHVLEAFGDFGDTFTEHSPSVAESAFFTDGEAFEHLVDDPEDLPVDWGDSGAAHVGDGWYMTEANTTDKKLQGAPSARATVGGALQMEMSLGSVAMNGVAAATPAPRLLKHVPLVGSVAAGRAWAGEGYVGAVLHDQPSIYARLNDLHGGAFVNRFDNHPSLGGGELGGLNGSATRLPSLVQTAALSAQESVRFSTGSLTIDNGPVVDPEEWTAEWWTNITTSSDEYQLDWTLYYPGQSHVLLRVRRTPTSLEATALRGGQIIVLSLSATMLNTGPHHLAFTFRRDPATSLATLKMYYDGTEVDTETTTFITPVPGDITPDMFPAVFLDNGGATYDEIAFYPTVLTPVQIATHYSAAFFVAPYSGRVSGQATVAGDMGVVRPLVSAVHGQATVGSVVTKRILFDDEVLPPGVHSYARNAYVPGDPEWVSIWTEVTPTFVDRADTSGGVPSTKALRLADIPDRARAKVEIPIEFGGTPSDLLRVRYFVSTESGYDEVSFHLDDPYLDEAANPFWFDSGISSAVEETVKSGISIGPHLLGIVLSKDGTGSDGFDNVDITRITYLGFVGPTLELVDPSGLPLAGLVVGVASTTGDLVVTGSSLNGELSTTVPIRRAFS